MFEVKFEAYLKEKCEKEDFENIIAVLRTCRLPVHFLQNFPLVNRDLCKVFIRINFIINDPFLVVGEVVRARITQISSTTTYYKQIQWKHNKLCLYTSTL